MELVRHLSIRVPWHDRNWDGHVCNQPLENSACLALKLIATRRRDDVESRIAQEAFDDLPEDEVPPCLRSSGTFLSPRAHAFESVMAYSPWSDDHKHLQPRTVHVPAWGALVIPYRWMLKESGFQQAKLLELDAHPEAEPTQPEWLTNTNWIQSHANQVALLEAFAAPIVEGESLVLFYTTRTPLCDDERRVLIGGALLNKKHGLVEYPSQGGELRAMVWERGIQHTLRPDRKSDGFTNGFVMPYREVMELLASRSELDAKDFVAFAPDDVRAQFSYGSEQVSHGAAAAALLAARAALGRIGEVLSGPWDRYVSWIDDRLSRLWKLQGPAPGLGVVLSALHTGFNGTLFAMALSDELAENADPWPVVDKIFSGKRKPPIGGPAVTSMLQKRWAKIKASEEKLDSLKLLARMELTREQAERGIDVDVAELLDNPYRLYELDRTNKEPTAFGIVDRGIYPGAEVASAHGLPGRCNPVLAEYDNSLRLRAACVQILEQAAAQGHTLLPVDRLPAAAEALPTVQDLPLDHELIDLCREEFGPVVAVTGVAKEMRLQLERYTAIGALLRSAVDNRLSNKPKRIAVKWRELVDDLFGKAHSHDEDEDRARTEKAAALQKLSGSRVAVLIGPAGTGKTTVLRLLLDQKRIVGPQVRLLAPTGKARVRLGQETKRPADVQTVAQYLVGLARFDTQTGRYYTNPTGPRSEATTCVVDESSMLTEDMLAAILDSLPESCRLILVGDPYQLPPIGAGCPFVDIIEYLQREKDGAGVAELTTPRRQGDAGPGFADSTPALARGDVQLAAIFSGRELPPGEDEIVVSSIQGIESDHFEIPSLGDDGRPYCIDRVGFA